MKKISTLIALFCAAFAANAQTYMVVETSEGNYNIDINDIKQVYWKTVKEETVEPFQGETTIWHDSQVGDKGLIDGQEVVVVKLNDMKVAIATCNYGAKTPDGDGTYMSFKKANAYSEQRAWGETWRLPTLQEYQTLMFDEGMEVKPYRVTTGCTWYVGPNRTVLFFPFSGEMSYGEVTGKGEVGYYWSSSKAGDGAWCMGIRPEENPMDATFYINAYSTDLLSVRLISDLRGRPSN